MSSKSKKSTRGANLETKTAAPKKPATVKTAGEKTETKKPAVKKSKWKYGAPTIRPNRENKTAQSVLGDRHKILVGVTAVDKNNQITATDAVNSAAFSLETAQKILANAMKREDVVYGRLYYKRADEQGNPQRGVYVGYAKDNGVKIVAEQPAS